MAGSPDDGEDPGETAGETADELGSMASLLAAVATTRTSRALATGTVVGGQYRVEHAIGQGGMGVVYLARDIRLDRDVAIKVGTAVSPSALARIEREAMALARLSHPNVVVVYQVGEVDGRIYIVMEHVYGGTARDWLTTPRSWREIVALYTAAGDGLAAAHAAGLIHRDFKPDNVLVGSDGRPRVADFGLARTADAIESAATTEPGVGVLVTQTGAIVGTPAYMPPEQLAGADVDARADQFAFAAVMWEALFGVRPFDGKTPAEVKAAVESKPPSSGSGDAPQRRVPRHLVAALQRALAADRTARWPDLAALLVALRRDPAARRRRIAIVGGALAVGIAGTLAAVIVTRSAEAPSCAGGALALDIRTPALDSAYARDSIPRIVGGLERYASDWDAIHETSCRAHHRGELSTAAYDRRTACLARRKAVVTAMSELTHTATAADLAGLVLAVGSLPDLSTCEDDDALLSPVPRPEPAQLAEATAITDLLARVDLERDAGRTDDAARGAEAAVSRARTLGYEPLIGRALVARGRIRLVLSQGDRGAADFAEATRLALTVGDEPLTIEAYARAAYALATASRSDTVAATDGLPLIEAITTRVGDRAPFPRALLHHNLGVVELAKGDRRAARIALERAHREAKDLTGSAAIEMTVVLQSLLLVVDDDATRERLADELVATRTRMLGSTHPLTLEAGLMRGGLMVDRERGRRELVAPCIAVGELHPTDRQLIRECSFEVAWRAAVAGDLPVAADMSRRVLAATAPGDSDTRIARAEAYLALATGDAAGALARFRAIVPVAADAPWWRRMVDVDVAIGMALAELARDNRDAAHAALDRAEQHARELSAAAPIDVGHRLDAITALRRR
jgi:hypothetical protein